jgi:hypothetical protein
VTRLQLLVPREFRIRAPFRVPEADALVDGAVPRECDQAEQSLPAAGSAMASGTASVGLGPTGIDDATLAGVCTGLWRARRRMVDQREGRAADEMRIPLRHIEAVWDTLEEAGIEISDHTGEPVPEYGVLLLDVLAYQPTPGIDRDRIVDTIRPSVYLRQRLVQMGQVIVGTPEGDVESCTEGREA